jgi:hypothetical protein
VAITTYNRTAPASSRLRASWPAIVPAAMAASAASVAMVASGVNVAAKTTRDLTATQFHGTKFGRPPRGVPR